MKIAYLGPQGSFQPRYADSFSQGGLQAFANITDIYRQGLIEQGLVNISMVSVENSIEGSVHETRPPFFFIRLAFKQWRNLSLFISS